MDDLTRLRYRRARGQGLRASSALWTARRPDAEPLDWDDDGATVVEVDGYVVTLRVMDDPDPLDWEVTPLDERLAYYRREYQRHEAWLRATREHAEDVALRERLDHLQINASATLDGEGYELGWSGLGSIDVDPCSDESRVYVDEVAREVAEDAALDAARTFAREFPRW